MYVQYVKLYVKCVCVCVYVVCVCAYVCALKTVLSNCGTCTTKPERYLAATCLDETREETNRSINTRGWKPRVGPKHTGARHPAPPANKVTGNITSVFLVQEQQQRVVQSSYVFTGRVKASGSNISA